MKWSALVFGLGTLFTRAVTSTAAASCFGDTAVQRSLEVQLTLFDAVAPNLMIVPLVPSANPLPVMVTVVPPALGPLLGLTLLTSGVNLK